MQLLYRVRRSASASRARGGVSRFDRVPSRRVRFKNLSKGVSMKRRGVPTMLGVWLLTAAIVCPQIKAQGNKPEPPPKLKVGVVPPDFTLPNSNCTHPN